MALHSLLGGAGISLAAHELLLLTGNVFGISGFVHRGVHGNPDSLVALAGLVTGGILIANMEHNALTVPIPSNISSGWFLLSGFLVGVGSKLAKGCTSGHMICGISRCSLRSMVATTTFFAVASVTANLLHGDFMAPVSSASSSLLSNKDSQMLLLQGIPLLAVTGLYYTISKANVPIHGVLRPLRCLTCFAISLQFALALHLSDLTQSSRVLGFLLPFRRGFDPSLLFVAISAIPFGMLLYQSVHSVGEKKGAGETEPPLGGHWVWKSAQNSIDAKLIGGCVIFGLGWGLTGICPGTGIVNVGRALGNGQIISPYAVWTVGMASGGIIAGQIESKL